MPFHVYILQSEKTGRFYVGQTQDVQERLARHNEGRAAYTRAGRPWRLVYQEEHESRSAAVQRESELKAKPRRSVLEGMVRSQSIGTG
jgi:putative endonuclease